ncbi:helix-turn-helix transcriptional regulator [Tahibacter amnicola]|uniref:Helix-turn-helix transcriptional regulator n=1 Tax=Tahibacter amnicola TaxID=2976241 RepID=A0ABY6BD84_9GAMM|nr:helix-turn-helix transcriptional regulator [Tahibacter amnicola]UXI66566.1 helix-turn-helix transcriptional regulator [Tahibacter amnicola]
MDRTDISRRLLDALKQALRARGITYAQVAKALELSEPSIKRLFSRGDFSLERLGRVCAMAELDFLDLAKLARQRSERTSQLTLAQEQALADDETLMLVFHLLLAGWKSADIRAHYGLTQAQTIRALAHLDRLRLIVLEPGDRVRLVVPRNVVWRRQGPVRRRYGDAALREFIDSSFEGTDEMLFLETRELGPASRVLIRRRLERLSQEFLELAELDAGLAPSSRRNVGLVLAMRPWVFSLARSRPEKAGSATGGHKPAPQRR